MAIRWRSSPFDYSTDAPCCPPRCPPPLLCRCCWPWPCCGSINATANANANTVSLPTPNWRGRKGGAAAVRGDRFARGLEHKKRIMLKLKFFMLKFCLRFLFIFFGVGEVKFLVWKRSMRKHIFFFCNWMQLLCRFLKISANKHVLVPETKATRSPLLWFGLSDIWTGATVLALYEPFLSDAWRQTYHISGKGKEKTKTPIPGRFVLTISQFSFSRFDCAYLWQYKPLRTDQLIHPSFSFMASRLSPLVAMAN